MIQEYYNFKLKNGRKDRKQGDLSVASVKKHSSILKMVLNEAVLLEFIDRNPAALVPLPKKVEKVVEPIFLNAEEANIVLKLFRGHELQPNVYICLYYGLRRSEIMGLKWNAIDFQNDILRIQHAVVKNRRIVAKDRLKGKDDKVAYQLLPEVKEVLLNLKAEVDNDKRLFGKSYFKSDYVFVKPDGTLRRPDCVTRGFQRALKRNNLPHMRFHDLRHAYVKPKLKKYHYFKYKNSYKKDVQNLNILFLFIRLFDSPAHVAYCKP